MTNRYSKTRTLARGTHVIKIDWVPEVERHFIGSMVITADQPFLVLEDSVQKRLRGKQMRMCVPGLNISLCYLPRALNLRVRRKTTVTIACH